MPVSHLHRLWLYCLGAIILCFLILPVLIVVPMSFSGSEYLEFPPRQWSLRWYGAFFGSREWMDAVWVTARVAFFTVLLATPLGVAAAYGIHTSQSRWGGWVQIALVAPVVVPVIIIAIGVFYLYAQINLINTITGLVLAHTILAIPFVIVTMNAGLRQFDLNQEKVARSLGASRLVAFWTVVRPQLHRSIFSSALFAFIASLDEVVIALFISRGEGSTLTRRMFTSLRDQIDPTIAAISTLLIAVSFLVAMLFGLQNLNMRRLFSRRRASAGTMPPTPE